MKILAWFVLICPWTLIITGLVVGLRKRKAANAGSQG